jgi:hypothetical protein
MSPLPMVGLVRQRSHPVEKIACKVKSGRYKRVRRVGHRKNLTAHKLHPAKRRLRCDCGQLAVTILKVRVGTDPQYTIHLPLCPACLALEQGFCADG